MAIALAVVALLVAGGWMLWVVSQGTNQFIEPGWSAFRYAAALLLAFAFAIAAVITVKLREPANRRITLAVGVIAGLEGLLFGFVWFALVVMPFPS